MKSKDITFILLQAKDGILSTEKAVDEIESLIRDDIRNTKLVTSETIDKNGMVSFVHITIKDAGAKITRYNKRHELLREFIEKSNNL